MVRWRVYYGDGTTADNLTHESDGLPVWNCQIIVQRDEKHNTVLLHRKDYYVYVGGEWLGLDIVGLLDYLANAWQSVEGCLFGRTITSTAFDVLMKQASTDSDFLRQSVGKGRFEG